MKTLADLLEQVVREAGCPEEINQTHNQEARLMFPNSAALDPIVVPDGIEPELHYLAIKLQLKLYMALLRSSKGFSEQVELEVNRHLRKN